MSDPLKFIFELVDKMSGPSRSISKELKAVDDAIRKSDVSLKRAAIDKMTNPLQKQRAELGLQRDALMATAANADEFAKKMSGAREAVSSAATVGLAVGGAISAVGVSFAKSAIEVASFAEDNKVALKVVTGSQSEANGILKDMIGLAAHLPITDQVAMGAATRFMLAGFKRNELQNMVTAMSDVQAMNPGRGIEAMNDFANLMTRVKTAGANVPHLLQAVTSELHIDPNAILKSLQGMGYLLKTVEQMRTALSSGAVNKNDFIQATIGAINAMTGGKGGGNISKELSTTLTGLLSTIEGRKFALMIDLDTSPGYASFRGFLQNLADLTDPNSATGKQVTAGITEAFNDTFGGIFAKFSGPDGAARLGAAIQTDVIPAFKDLATIFGALASVTMTIASGWAEIVRWVRYVKDGDSDTKAQKGILAGKNLDQLKASAAGGYLAAYPREMVIEAAKLAGIKAGVGSEAGADQVGRALANGLASGMAAGTPVVTDAGASLGQAAIDAHKAVTETHSPSRVFEELGRMTAEGYALGVRGGTDAAQGAVAAMGAAPRAMGSGAAGGGAVVHLAVNVDARGAEKEDADAIATAIGDALPSAVVRVFDMLATQYGNP